MSKYTLLRFSFFRYYSHSLVFSFLIEAAAAVIIRLTAVAAVCRFWSVRAAAAVSCTGGIAACRIWNIQTVAALASGIVAIFT